MPFMQHLKVMVVDDTSVSRMLLVDSLNGIGIKNITLAGDGEQALQLMMASPCHIRSFRCFIEPVNSKSSAI